MDTKKNKFPLIMLIPIIGGIGLLAAGLIANREDLRMAGVAVLFGGSAFTAVIMSIVAVVAAVRTSDAEAEKRREERKNEVLSEIQMRIAEKRGDNADKTETAETDNGAARREAKLAELKAILEARAKAITPRDRAEYAQREESERSVGATDAGKSENGTSCEVVPEVLPTTNIETVPHAEERADMAADDVNAGHADMAAAKAEAPTDSAALPAAEHNGYNASPIRKRASVTYKGINRNK